MAYTFNPFTGNFDYYEKVQVKLLEYPVDPSAAPGDTWILRTTNNAANTLQAFVGGIPLTTQTVDYKYQLSFMSADEGVKRVELT